MSAAGGVDARPLRRADSLMERVVVVDGRPVRYLAAGSGPAVLLLHGLGESPADWVAVLARLARSRAVYAPALPGFQGHHGAADVSADGHASFVGRFLDAVGLQQAVLVGHSLGGLAALLVALASSERVTALCLVGGGGLGREVSPALAMLSEPLLGEVGIAWSRTRAGAAQRAWGKALLLFGRPWRIPAAWLVEQYRLARRPGFLDAALAALRDQVGPAGQPPGSPTLPWPCYPPAATCRMSRTRRRLAGPWSRSSIRPTSARVAPEAAADQALRLA